jgi:hypothetical protein
MRRIRKFADIKWVPFDPVDSTLRKRAKTEVDCAAQVAEIETRWRERCTLIDVDIARREAEKPLAIREREHTEAVQQGQRIVNRLHDQLRRQGISDRIEDWPSLKRACRKYWMKIGRSAADFLRVGPRTILWILETQARLPKTVYGGPIAPSLNLPTGSLYGTEYRRSLLDKINRIANDGRALVTPSAQRHDCVLECSEKNRKRIEADRVCRSNRREKGTAQVTTYELTAKHNEIIKQEARRCYHLLRAKKSSCGSLGYLEYDVDDFIQEGYLVVSELLIARNDKPIDEPLLRDALQKKFSKKLEDLIEKTPDEVALTIRRRGPNGDYNRDDAEEAGSDRIEFEGLHLNGDHSWMRNRSATSLDPEDLTEDQNAIASLLMTNPEFSEAEIGKELGFSQSKVSRIIGVLRSRVDDSEPPKRLAQ